MFGKNCAQARHEKQKGGGKKRAVHCLGFENRVRKNVLFSSLFSTVLCLNTLYISSEVYTHLSSPEVKTTFDANFCDDADDDGGLFFFSLSLSLCLFVCLFGETTLRTGIQFSDRFLYICDTMIEFWERLTPPSPSLYHVATNAHPLCATFLCRKKE